jgi:poly(3-hydroxybutyrate) depolymerase
MLPAVLSSRLRRLLSALAAFVFTVASVTASTATPIVPGKGRILVEAGETLEVFTYKPANYAGGPLLLVFHGVGRNAEEYRDFAIPLADRFGFLLVAPLFDKERFPTDRYQRGGVFKAGALQPREAWTFAMVPRIVESVRRLEARPELPFWMIGHSAGGQFVVRLVALAGTLGASGVVAANPGTHLFPTREAPFSFGFGGLPETVADADAVRRYVEAPLVLFLGTGDVDGEHRSLNRDAEAMKQGATRLERGRNCFAAAETLARERGWKFGWRKVEVPGTQHDAAQMFAAPEAKEALFGR